MSEPDFDWGWTKDWSPPKAPRGKDFEECGRLMQEHFGKCVVCAQDAAYKFWGKIDGVITSRSFCKEHRDDDWPKGKTLRIEQELLQGIGNIYRKGTNDGDGRVAERTGSG